VVGQPHTRDASIQIKLG